ncbi:MAG TPA: hypothetical protein PK079_12315 [Leptospiraceae bacterium]|nr:hypothetical protein [Leptospiraceae bacterium]HMX32149.1 hypothetical protein [Leptospiraceae bacterium]HMY31228.1 hypothetical protein [Leptospiraceae bacterium]HMZ63285.1 hypothetical protein [Leptospiraceae bacterium]HNC55497.1 hypothetical protein [Leptospiraceae bacterium]
MKFSMIFLVVHFLLIGSILGQVAPKQKRKQILLEYKSPTKTIRILDTSFVLTEKKDVYDNPVSSIPSKSTFKEKDYTLTKKEVYDLIKFIEDNEFFQLKDAYGAPEAERNYPTSIAVQMHKKEKVVVYRSNPSFESSPEAFKKVEAYILKLRK